MFTIKKRNSLNFIKAKHFNYQDKSHKSRPNFTHWPWMQQMTGHVKRSASRGRYHSEYRPLCAGLRLTMTSSLCVSPLCCRTMGNTQTKRPRELRNSRTVGSPPPTMQVLPGDVTRSDLTRERNRGRTPGGTEWHRLERQTSFCCVCRMLSINYFDWWVEVFEL